MSTVVKNYKHQEFKVEDDRTGLSVESLKRAFADNLYYIQGKFPGIATRHDYYMALAYTVRDRLLQRWIRTVETYVNNDVRVVSYLSAEYLLGPHLANNLINLGIYDRVEEALEQSGMKLTELIEQEVEPGLGNGGLGRLAACYLDSLATLEIPAIGYGIRYEFGIFKQEIRDGWQVEVTDKWLYSGNPWEIPRPETTFQVKFGGHTEHYEDDEGHFRARWVPGHVVMGMAYDTPIVGYRVNTTNTLRLWKAEACESFDFQSFNIGDYYGAIEEKVVSENITKVLYPNDEPLQGKHLRLQQQYFFVSCSLQDMIRMHLLVGGRLDAFHEKFAVQLNDTHPSIGVAELMRLLVDEHHLDWDTAWHVTRNSFAYTNHTLLPEALETWPMDLFAEVLPRHTEIISEINRRFLDDVRIKHPGDQARLERMSIIANDGEHSIRMANLASVGSFAINGVAALHTKLLKANVLHDFYELTPEKFNNKTNGVTPRRFLLLSNPRLSRLISSRIDDEWPRRLEGLRALEPFADDPDFREEWRRVKLQNKRDLARLIKQRTDISVDPGSLFDVLVKRLHEYKRQDLDVLNIITTYCRLKHDPGLELVPRTFIFGAKAAPGYDTAKLIIKLITSVADVVNADPDVRDLIKVVFIPNYNVKIAQRIFPAADLSEQISTAGKEASGTGNMKFAMNGALTIGTLDGANVEIREEVGAENLFLFGLTAEEVQQAKAQGYRPRDYYDSNAHLREAIDLIGSGFFSHGDKGLFWPLVNSWLEQDQYMVLADYQAYADAQAEVNHAYADREHWTRMSILNVARIGKFSSDRSIREYCEDIWHVKAVPVKLREF